jgi:hypothetical protein
MLRIAPPPHSVVGFPDMTCTADARRAVRQLLGGHATVPACERAELAISEVVQNALDLDALRRVSMWHEPGQRGVRVDVEDSAPGEAAIRPSDTWGRGGFGLRIVDAVSDRWGVTPHPGSKSVWFEIDY